MSQWRSAVLIGGETAGEPGAHAPPPFKLSGMVTFFDFVTKKHKTIKELFWLEYKYGLRSDLRATDFNTFTRGACPQTPLACACLRTHHHQFPPLNLKYLPPPLVLETFSRSFQVHYFVVESPYNDTGLPSFSLLKGLACHSVARAQVFCCPVVTSKQTNHCPSL